MDARNQYLKVLQKRYFAARSKKEKSDILNEYCENTEQNRKYVIRKINSSFSSQPKKKRTRKRTYDGYLTAALKRVWEIFDYPCGQRLEPLLRKQVGNLRELGELEVSDEIAKKLKEIASATIDRRLRRQKQALRISRKQGRNRNPLIYQSVPVKAAGWDRSLPGQVQIDLVQHCGQSASGYFGNSISCCDIASGWWEAEAVMGKGQQRVFQGLAHIKERVPFILREIHPDNDTAFINHQLIRYCNKEHIEFTRSRPYKKNDNSFVEQKNATHIRAVVGHLRYDKDEQISCINHLYRNQLRLYKNFFQPVMKLKEKVRQEGKIHRKYDEPKTPYERLTESPHIPDTTKNRLHIIYHSLNPAQLKRDIDSSLDKLYHLYEEENKIEKVEPCKKQKPLTVTL